MAAPKLRCTSQVTQKGETSQSVRMVVSKKVMSFRIVKKGTCWLAARLIIMTIMPNTALKSEKTNRLLKTKKAYNWAVTCRSRDVLVWSPALIDSRRKMMGRK